MRKNFTKLIVLGTVLFSVHSSAQFDPYYTHYMLNKLAFNPATAGEKDAICINALTHQQWTKQTDQSASFFEGAPPTKLFDKVNPRTNSFSITAPLLNNKLGVGFQAIQDKIGFNTNLYLRGSLSWKFRMGRKLPDGSTDQTLAVGADFGMVQVGVDGTKYNPLTAGDPHIPSGQVSGGTFDMGAGVYYTHQRLFDGFYIGASMTHITAPSVNLEKTVNWKTHQYLYILAGTRHDMGAIALMPSILIKTVGTPTQVDLGCRALFNEKLVAGLNLRSGDAISLLLGYYVMPNLYAGYSYDITAISGVRKYTSAGTHEIFISYCFDLKVPGPPPLKPRYNVRYLEGYTLY